jgi:predicted GTPase
MRYGHELGDRGVTKDSMVGAFEVSKHKVNVVDTKVICRAKLHR